MGLRVPPRRAGRFAEPIEVTLVPRRDRLRVLRQVQGPGRLSAPRWPVTVWPDQLLSHRGGNAGRRADERHRWPPRKAPSQDQLPSCPTCSSPQASCRLSAATTPERRQRVEVDWVALDTGLPSTGGIHPAGYSGELQDDRPGSIPHPSVGTQGAPVCLRFPVGSFLTPTYSCQGTEKVNAPQMTWIGIRGRLIGLESGRPGR